MKKNIQSVSYPPICSLPTHLFPTPISVPYPHICSLPTHLFPTHPSVSYPPICPPICFLPPYLFLTHPSVPYPPICSLPTHLFPTHPSVSYPPSVPPPICFLPPSVPYPPICSLFPTPHLFPAHPSVPYPPICSLPTHQQLHRYAPWTPWESGRSWGCRAWPQGQGLFPSAWSRPGTPLQSRGCCDSAAVGTPPCPECFPSLSGSCHSGMHH